MKTGYIHSFESLGALDGPGLRFIVFFSGCPLRCLYCHNPDTWDMGTGTKTTSQAIFRKAQRYQPFFSNGGGITFSGGEPFLQPEFALEILRKCRETGISTCVDTSGSILNDRVKSALEYTDLVILDVKHTDAETFKALTGGCLNTHKAFLEHCKTRRIPLWIRQVILPGWNDTVDEIQALLKYIKGANVQKIELLPYHTLGVNKWETMGIPYALNGIEPPSPEKMAELREAAAYDWDQYS